MQSVVVDSTPDDSKTQPDKVNEIKSTNVRINDGVKQNLQPFLSNEKIKS